MFAVRRTDTGEWLNRHHRNASWDKVPKLYDTLERAKRSLSGFKATERKYNYRDKNNIDEIFKNVEIVEVGVRVKGVVH